MELELELRLLWEAPRPLPTRPLSEQSCSSLVFEARNELDVPEGRTMSSSLTRFWHMKDKLWAAGGQMVKQIKPKAAQDKKWL